MAFAFAQSGNMPHQEARPAECETLQQDPVDELARFKQPGAPPDPGTFVQLIEAHARAREVDHVCALFSSMLTMGVSPPPALYDVLLELATWANCKVAGMLDEETPPSAAAPVTNDVCDVANAVASFSFGH